MATVKVPATYDAASFLIADDEPEHLEWLIDYLEARGVKVEVVINVEQAIKAIEAKKFGGYVIDLNIPLAGWEPYVNKTNPAYEHYQGLHIIQMVRTQGNGGAKVIAYSAHFNEQITAEIKTLYCEYFVKGRAHELKNKIDGLLSPSVKTPPASKKAGKP